MSSESIATISEYMHCFREQPYPELFSGQCIFALDNIEKRYGDTHASQVIFELPVYDAGEIVTAPGCADFSLAIETPDDVAREYWLEMDYRDYARKDGGDIPASVFYHGGSLKPESDDETGATFYSTILLRLLDEETAGALTPGLREAVKALKGRSSAMFQVGAMLARGENKSLRVETDKLRRTKLIEYLKELNWAGDTEWLDAFLRTWVPSSGRFILGFDLSKEGISERIGIEISGRSKKYEATDILLDTLVKEGFLSIEKRDALCRFIRTAPQLDPLIQNDISHCKFVILDNRIIQVKVYLRQSGLFLSDEAPALKHPWHMNLELSDKCPLHCPQCYVSLNKSREMPLDTALYWLRDAANYGISTVSLSGGETLAYPHLDKVIGECKRLGLAANIAISGIYLDRERLKRLKASGVNEIYISLNGSTKEVNSFSRNGYEYAVSALKLLKESDFPDICVNWVMHHSNTQDFPDMIKLCEAYAVKKLIILGFKPDSSGQLKDYPTADDMRYVSDIVKGYTGEMYIDAEPCFSQLRALIHQGHLWNINTGLLRGCGAGRDSVSVTCEGRLTPCRHLDKEEEWTSIKDYWEKSEYLDILREINDNPKGRCSSCRFNKNCLPCVATLYKMHGRTAFESPECAL